MTQRDGGTSSPDHGLIPLDIHSDPPRNARMKPLALLLGCALLPRQRAQASTPGPDLLPGVNLPRPTRWKGRAPPSLYGRDRPGEGHRSAGVRPLRRGSVHRLRSWRFLWRRPGASSVRRCVPSTPSTGTRVRIPGLNLGFVNLTNNVQGGLNWGRSPAKGNAWPTSVSSTMPSAPPSSSVLSMPQKPRRPADGARQLRRERHLPHTAPGELQKKSF